MARLAALLEALERAGGKPAPLPKRTAWELVLLETAAYLVEDERREETLASLVRSIGTAPAALRSAPLPLLARAIAGGGMKPEMRAGKVAECAATVLSRMGGDLDAALRDAADVAARRKLLRAFPGIGEPGADKVLLLSGIDVVPALDSNGLRSLERLGLVASGASYEKSYRAGRGLLADALPASRARLVAAFGLLRRHGRTLCRSRMPLCGDCPLAEECPSALGG